MRMRIRVASLGIIARHVISQNQDASILGVTSRGLFLHTQPDWVLFLSGETYRGPLTLNLEWSAGIFEEMNPDHRVNIQDRDLFFPPSDLCIFTGEAEEWSPCVPSSVILPPPERQFYLSAVTTQVLAQSEALPAAELRELLRALKSCNERRIVRALEPLLGRGNGLTPSGDDLIVGLLLTLNRWGRQFYPYQWLEEINHPIIQAAHQKTTTLSASLIECAARAQADERLVLALDNLVTGKPDLVTCIACLRSYGSSSGRDAFQGMALALTSMGCQMDAARTGLENNCSNGLWYTLP